MTKKILSLIATSAFSSLAFAAGTCEIYTVKPRNFLETNPKREIVGTLTNVSYSACAEAAATELNKSKTSDVRAKYVTQDGGLKGNLVVKGQEKMQYALSFAQQRQARGCFARADYRNLLRGTFANHEGRILISNSAQETNLAECFQSAGAAYVNAIASGQSLRTLYLTFWLADQVVVTSDIDTDFEDASFVNETFQFAL